MWFEMIDSALLINTIMVVVVILIGVVLIKFVVSFDLNKYLEFRNKRRKEIFQANCPHCVIEYTDGEFSIKSLFHSPLGRIQWQCSRCAKIVDVEKSAIDSLDFWTRNPKLLLMRQKRIAKLARRFYKTKI